MTQTWPCIGRGRKNLWILLNRIFGDQRTETVCSFRGVFAPFELFNTAQPTYFLSSCQNKSPTRVSILCILFDTSKTTCWLGLWSSGPGPGPGPLSPPDHHHLCHLLHSRVSPAVHEETAGETAAGASSVRETVNTSSRERRTGCQRADADIDARAAEGKRGGCLCGCHVGRTGRQIWHSQKPSGSQGGTNESINTSVKPNGLSRVRNLFFFSGFIIRDWGNFLGCCLCFFSSSFIQKLFWTVFNLLTFF